MVDGAVNGAGPDDTAGADETVERIVAEVAELLDSLRGIYDEVAVDESSHARQAAARALADGADDELVVAATLHDLAHSPLVGGPAAHRHDEIARRWLTPRFGERVGWLAGAHVAAKRHLAATEPGYAAALSSVSVASLRHQGGSGVGPEWTTHRWWPDALRLRRYDDAAKRVGDPGADQRHILTVVERVARQRRAWGS